MLEIGPIVKSLLRNKVAPMLMLLQLALSVAIVSNILFFISERVSKVTRHTGFAHEKLGKISFYRNLANVNFSQEVIADLDFIRVQEGVAEACLSSGIPMSGMGESLEFSRDPGNSEFYSATIMYTDDHAISTFGFILSEGRNFSPEEVGIFAREEMPTQMKAIITESFAKTIFPAGSALGKVFYEGQDSYTIIGIVRDFVGYWPKWEYKYNSVLTSYFPRDTFKNFVVRSDVNNLTALMWEISDKLVEREAARTLWGQETLKVVKRRQFNSEYSMIKILSIVVVLVVFVNALGIVGLTTFWVNQRRKQIGIRRAIGATRTMIIRYFITENLILMFSASILGALIAYTVSSYLVQLYAVTLLPWQYIVCASLVMFFVSISSALVPVCNASLVSPAEAVYD